MKLSDLGLSVLTTATVIEAAAINGHAKDNWRPADACTPAAMVTVTANPIPIPTGAINSLIGALRPVYPSNLVSMLIAGLPTGIGTRTIDNIIEASTIINITPTAPGATISLELDGSFITSIGMPPASSMVQSSSSTLVQVPSSSSIPSIVPSSSSTVPSIVPSSSSTVPTIVPSSSSIVSSTVPSSSSTAPDTTTSSSAPSSSATLEAYLDPTFINTVLDYHNVLRAVNSAPNVTWDPTKALYAQNYADQCVFQHSGGPYGENLAAGGYNNPAYYVWLWYNEINAYTSFSNPDFTNFASWGHFTQVVWESTTSIGCGFATTCTSLGNFGPYYLVCEYNTGNVLPIQNFVANVLPPTAPEPVQPVASI